jgi:hypothetical protein
MEQIRRQEIATEIEKTLERQQSLIVKSLNVIHPKQDTKVEPKHPIHYLRSDTEVGPKIRRHPQKDHGSEVKFN